MANKNQISYMEDLIKSLTFEAKNLEKLDLSTPAIIVRKTIKSLKLNLDILKAELEDEKSFREEFDKNHPDEEEF